MERITQQAVIDDPSQLEKVVADSKAHGGLEGYDPILVTVREDGSGEISTSQGVKCEVTFQAMA